MRLRVCWRSDSSPSLSQLLPSVFLFVASFLISGPFNLKIYVHSRYRGGAWGVEGFEQTPGAALATAGERWAFLAEEAAG